MKGYDTIEPKILIVKYFIIFQTL